MKSIARTKYEDKFAIAVYPDQGRWVAHNLSLDIVATSAKKSKALEELHRLTISQIQFAISHHMPETINHPAPERFWKMISEKMTASLVGKLFRLSEARKMTEKMLSRSPIYDLTNPRKHRLA